MRTSVPGWGRSSRQPQVGARVGEAVGINVGRVVGLDVGCWNHPNPPLCQHLSPLPPQPEHPLPLTEATLAELVRLYWKELSEQDRHRIQYKAQRNWYYHLSSTSQDLKNDHVQQIHAHCLHQDTPD
jgi:hypothetical protein